MKGKGKLKFGAGCSNLCGLLISQARHEKAAVGENAAFGLNW
jgi:hypothetical protein